MDPQTLANRRSSTILLEFFLRNPMKVVSNTEIRQFYKSRMYTLTTSIPSVMLKHRSMYPWFRIRVIVRGGNGKGRQNYYMFGGLTDDAPCNTKELLANIEESRTLTRPEYYDRFYGERKSPAEREREENERHERYLRTFTTRSDALLPGLWEEIQRLYTPQ